MSFLCFDYLSLDSICNATYARSSWHGKYFKISYVNILSMTAVKVNTIPIINKYFH